MGTRNFNTFLWLFIWTKSPFINRANIFGAASPTSINLRTMQFGKVQWFLSTAPKPIIPNIKGFTHLVLDRTNQTFNSWRCKIPHETPSPQFSFAPLSGWRSSQFNIISHEKQRDCSSLESINLFVPNCGSSNKWKLFASDYFHWN